MSLHRLTFNADFPNEGHSVGAFLRSSDGTLITHTTVSGKEALDVNLAGPLELEVIIEAEYAEDSVHVSGDVGSFVMGVRDDGVQASVVAEGATFTAVNFGTSGNSISLTFDGIDTIDTVVNAWNAANPANQVTYTGVIGSTVLSAQVVTLVNGAANSVLTSGDKDYSPFAVDQYGQLKVRDDAVLAKLNSGVVVTATDLDIRALLFATDSVDVSGSSVSITGNVNVTQGTSPWVVSATDLDIRALSFVTDSVDVSGSAVSITGSVAVTATDLDIRDLTHVSDSVRLGDGTSFYTSTTVNSDIGLDVYQLNDPELANVALATAANALAVGNTAQSVVTSPLANRKYLYVMNDSNRDAWIGTTGVTSANGFPLPQGSMLTLRAGAAVNVAWVGPTAAKTVRTLELS